MNRFQKTGSGVVRHNAMVFSDEDANLLTAFATAQKFAGDNGRVATLPDIISARLRSPTTDTVWSRRLTTATAEYVGMSAGGERIIIVAHGVGPLADATGIGLSHMRGFDARGRSGAPGLISSEEFLKLESGAYGSVIIIELRDLYRLRRSPFTEMLSYDQACADPLVRARLGPEAEAFLTHHRKISKRWREENEIDGRYHDCVMCLSGTRRLGYAAAMFNGDAYAHLIDVSPLTDYRHAHWEGPMRMERSLVTETAPQATDEPAHCVGIRGNGPIVKTHPGVTLAHEQFAGVWPELLRPVEEARMPSLTELFPIAKYGGRWFTRYAGTFGGPEGGQPCHPVTGLTSRSHDESFMMPIIGGDHRVVTVDHPLIRDEAPDWANAYRIVTRPRTVWQKDVPTFHAITVRYHAADIMRGWRLPTTRELEQEFDLLLSLGTPTTDDAQSLAQDTAESA